MTIIIADTSCGIPVHEAKELNIPLLPQILIFGQDSFRDDYEIDHDTFITKLKGSSELPKTAAPSPELYKPYFEKAEDEKQDVIIICPSSVLSGTYNSAITAANENGKLNIYVIDTKLIGGSLSTLVLLAKQWATAGMPAKDIVININKLLPKATNYFVVDSLDYLHRGGRIGGAQHLFGNMLQIKPILSIKDGKVEPAENQRTKSRAISRLFELVAVDFPGNEYGHLSIMHGDAESDAYLLADQFKEKYDLKHVPVYHLPPAILAHAGPGILGVGYFKK